MKFKLEACTLCYMLLPIYMSLYNICTNIPRIPPLPLSVRLKHPSLSPDRESAPHCRTIALGWYISITLVITYSVIHSTCDSYAKLKKFLSTCTLYWKWFLWRQFVYLNTALSNFSCIACKNMSQINNISLSFYNYRYLLAMFSKIVYMHVFCKSCINIKRLTGLKIDSYDSSSIPSRRGKLTA